MHFSDVGRHKWGFMFRRLGVKTCSPVSNVYGTYDWPFKMLMLLMAWPSVKVSGMDVMKGDRILERCNRRRVIE